MMVYFLEAYKATFLQVSIKIQQILLNIFLYCRTFVWFELFRFDKINPVITQVSFDTCPILHLARLGVH